MAPPPARIEAIERKTPRRDDRQLRKEMSNLERTIARLDKQKQDLNSQLLNTAAADEALRVHNELTSISQELSAAEDRWCELQLELEGE
jgi:ATP-binding cassette subfamily F protein 3